MSSIQIYVPALGNPFFKKLFKVGLFLKTPQMNLQWFCWNALG